MKYAIILFFLVFVSSCFGQLKEVVSMEEEGWKTYQVIENIKIEYRIDKCEDGENNNEVWAVFRFTNNSLSEKEISWTPKWERDNVCVNCNYLNDKEFKHTIHLAPNETIQGEACVNKDSRTYIFSHFVTVYPGMDKKKLTSFEFIDITVKEI
ncbi:MAG: hypothetical protein COA33_001660 [Fluviicola sp.]|nr:hypothetical protein [Fluviicola sp.]